MNKNGTATKRRIRIPKPKCGTWPRALPKATKHIGFRIGRVIAYGWYSTWGVGYVEVRLILGVGRHRVLSLASTQSKDAPEWSSAAPDKTRVEAAAKAHHASLFAAQEAP